MKKASALRNILLTCAVVCISFFISFVFQKIFKNSSFTAAILILGIYAVNRITGCFWCGAAASAVSAAVFGFVFLKEVPDFGATQKITAAVILFDILIALCFAEAAGMRHFGNIRGDIGRSRVQTAILRSVSHDVKTPLTTLVGSSSVMLKNGDRFSEEQKLKMLNSIHNSALQLTQMLDNLFSIVKLNAGGAKISKTPVALEELVDSALSKFRTKCPGYEVKVMLPEEFISIPMDPLLIEQVILNIMENAVSHAASMTELSLKVYTKAGKAVFEISDNGCGIPADKLKSLFNDRGSGKTATGGNARNGVGLLVCSEIIKAHGGTLKAENLKDGGAAFRFILDMGNA